MLSIDNFHIKMVLVLLSICILMVLYRVRENFIKNKFTGESTYKNTNYKQYTPLKGWKTLWNENFNDSSVSYENSYSKSPFGCFSNDRLTYDGI